MTSHVMGKFLQKSGTIDSKTLSGTSRTSHTLSPHGSHGPQGSHGVHGADMYGHNGHKYPSLVFVPPNLISIPSSRGSGPQSNKGLGSIASLTHQGQGQGSQHKDQGQGQGDQDEFSYDFQSIDRVLMALETCRVTEVKRYDVAGTDGSGGEKERGLEKGLASGFEKGSEKGLESEKGVSMRRILRLGVIASRSTDVLLVAQLMVNAMVTHHINPLINTPYQPFQTYIPTLSILLSTHPINLSRHTYSQCDVTY